MDATSESEMLAMPISLRAPFTPFSSSAFAVCMHSSRAWSISMRERPMPFATLPCSYRGLPKATRSLALEIISPSATSAMPTQRMP